MSSVLARAGAIDDLTDEQRLAAASDATLLFIEAGPGTGKTTVSAQRFGVQRFAPAQRYDHRATVAVSFTRSATHTLRRRVQRLWGPTALVWPHRIVTLDTIVCDLVHDLLRSGLLSWPNTDRLWPDRLVKLDVHDSWAAFGAATWNDSHYVITVAAPAITIHHGVTHHSAATVPATVAIAQLKQGICTHQDVRDVLGQAMTDPKCAAHVQRRLLESMRTLIVDEIFDANDLDITIIEAAINAGVAVTLVGDPWQALYLFRGAAPHLVPHLIERARIDTLPLTQSFRWRGKSQHDLAQDLRASRGVTLPVVAADHLADIDVVLALRWKDLWDLSGTVLPLAFSGFRGGYEEAAATLLLNHMTRSILDLDAVYLNDALTALALPGREILYRLGPGFQDVVEILRPGSASSATAAYRRLVDVMSGVSPRHLRRPHKAHTMRLALIQQRLARHDRLAPGLTTHQAKGNEWEVVGVRLNDQERSALAVGLSVDVDMDRKLYVACTRARFRTVELRPT